ncbi:MAG: hypothetical protein ACRYGK_04085 [Janthinobacterium lividum]
MEARQLADNAAAGAIEANGSVPDDGSAQHLNDATAVPSTDAGARHTDAERAKPVADLAATDPVFIPAPALVDAETAPMIDIDATPWGSSNAISLSVEETLPMIDIDTSELDQSAATPVAVHRASFSELLQAAQELAAPAAPDDGGNRRGIADGDGDLDEGREGQEGPAEARTGRQ